jgi:hypothetical protein
VPLRGSLSGSRRHGSDGMGLALEQLFGDGGVGGAAGVSEDWVGSSPFRAASEKGRFIPAIYFLMEGRDAVGGSEGSNLLGRR